MPSGPCCFCGATNYPMSLGGPYICPSCDCGNFGPDAMKRQGKELNRLRTRVESLEADKARLRDAAELAYSEMAFTVHDISDPRRRRRDHEWSEQRGSSLAKTADELRAALDAMGGGDDNES